MLVIFRLNMNIRDQRFAQEDHYEWFKDYSYFRHLILEYIEPSSAVNASYILNSFVFLFATDYENESILCMYMYYIMWLSDQ